MKTDLNKIMAIAGYHGLYRYIAQNKGGVIVESMADDKRSWMGPSARMSTLSDIYIYTQEGEMKLQEVFEAIRDKNEPLPEPAAKPEAIKAFFGNVVPQYDADRFYVSHMKKVVEWYRELAARDALDFESPDTQEAKE